MKCVCGHNDSQNAGYSSENSKFHEVNNILNVGKTEDNHISIFICPKCGTLKVHDDELDFIV